MTDPGAWVRESKFGVWFLTTNVWKNHVLEIAILELQRLMGKRARFSRIVDVGCGDGASFQFLEQRFRPDQLIGFDIDAKLISRGAASVSNCKCDVQLRVGNAVALDLPDSSVDLIFCHQTMHHISDQYAVVCEFRRVLVPGGLLLFAESCRTFIQSPVVRFLFRHPMEAQRSAAEYLDLLHQAGFVFDAANVSTPYPPWSRPDFGLLELLGQRAQMRREAPLVFVAAARA